METTNITLLNGTIAFLGMLLFFLIRYKNRKNKHKEFQIAYWLNDNAFELILSFVTSAICFLLLDDLVIYLASIMPQGLPYVKITAFSCGFSNQWILKLITKPFKEKN